MIFKAISRFVRNINNDWFDYLVVDPHSPEPRMTPDWSELVRNHRALVISVVRRIVGNDEDTEDVAQEVFWEACRASERQVIEMWPGFLRRLATCRALDLVSRPTFRFANRNRRYCRSRAGSAGDRRWT